LIQEIRDTQAPPYPPASVVRRVGSTSLPGSRTPIIGDAKRIADLDELGLLDTYPRLSPPAASALVRAARLYQGALWDSERDAALSWILFASALEAAAGVAYKDKEKQWSAVEMLRELDPRLFKACEPGGEKVVKNLATGGMAARDAVDRTPVQQGARGPRRNARPGIRN
jgi:hypothetical protein